MGAKRKFKEVDLGDGNASLGRTIALDEESANNLVAYQTTHPVLWEEVVTPAKTKPDAE